MDIIKFLEDINLEKKAKEVGSYSLSFSIALGHLDSWFLRKSDSQSLTGTSTTNSTYSHSFSSDCVIPGFWFSIQLIDCRLWDFLVSIIMWANCCKKISLYVSLCIYVLLVLLLWRTCINTTSWSHLVFERIRIQEESLRRWKSLSCWGLWCDKNSREIIDQEAKRKEIGGDVN